jgi:hypothetical protein
MGIEKHLDSKELNCTLSITSKRSIELKLVLEETKFDWS